MQIENREIEPDIKLLTLSGRLVMGREAQRIEWLVEEMLKQGQTKIVFDMTKVDYIDSSGIGILVGCAGRAMQAGGGLRIVGVTERVHHIMQVTAVTQVLAIHPDLQSACAAF